MFRIRDPQESLWQSQFLVTPKKAKRLERSWAEVFRNEALPLIDEERFAPMYCVDNGRPNRAVQTVLGVHLLKEMFNLTDDEALEQLELKGTTCSGHCGHALRDLLDSVREPDRDGAHLPQTPGPRRPLFTGVIESWKLTARFPGSSATRPPERLRAATTRTM